MNDSVLTTLSGQVLAALLQRSHLMAPADLPDHLTEVARPLGVSAIQIYLADLQQLRLHAMTGDSAGTHRSLKIDSTLAGRAFQTFTIHRAHGESPAGERRFWVPLVDGTERLGVMELTLAADPGEDDDAAFELGRTLGSLAGLIIASKSASSDAYAALRRHREMSVQAEMVWAFMAPRTFATGRVILAASLEPAYEIGGDAFDHALLGDHLHVALFDSVGHDLTAGLISSVALAACRAARRSGGTLTDIAAHADQAINGQFGESRFATALLCDLHTTTGEFTWLPCGHPAPLLIRDGKVIKQLLREPRLPLGLSEDAAGHDGAPGPAYAERLQPGDRVLLYTDGVVEGRGPEGKEFGLERLSDFVIRHSTEGLAAPETLRRLNHVIMNYQQGRLRDDATVILLEWLPHDPERRLTV